MGLFIFLLIMLGAAWWMGNEVSQMKPPKAPLAPPPVEHHTSAKPVEVAPVPTAEPPKTESGDTAAPAESSPTNDSTAPTK